MRTSKLGWVVWADHMLPNTKTTLVEAHVAAVAAVQMARYCYGLLKPHHLTEVLDGVYIRVGDVDICFEQDASTNELEAYAYPIELGITLTTRGGVRVYPRTAETAEWLEDE